MIEDKKSDRRYKKKRRLKGYWKFLAIYSGVLAGLIVIGLIWVYGLLGAYEKGMPDVAMDNIIRTQFSSENIDNLVNQNAGEVSPYEDVDNVRKYLENTVNGNLTFARKSGEYTNDSPVYLVKSDDKNIAKVSLKETGKNRRGFSVWAVDAVTFGEFLGKDNAITITAPSDAVVTINGKQAGEDIMLRFRVIMSTGLRDLWLSRRLRLFLMAGSSNLRKMIVLMEHIRQHILQMMNSLQARVTILRILILNMVNISLIREALHVLRVI